MRSFRNNNRRSRYRSNGDRNFKRNGENQSFTSNANFQRKSPGRNNQNASKLIEKYTDLAREALSNGDKILSENYYQYADHFLRVVGNKNSAEDNSKNNLDNVNSSKNSEDQIISDSENNTFSKISNNQKEN